MTKFEFLQTGTLEQVAEFFDKYCISCNICPARSNYKTCMEYLFCSDGVKDFLMSEVEK